MKKKILFPSTSRVHKARQKLLLQELEREFEVQVIEYEPEGVGMAEKAGSTYKHFLLEFKKSRPDLLLARGDRFEILPIVMAAAYMNIPIAHIEGGDLSSVIDGKVRHSISHLADYHFPTNQDAHERLVRMGVPMDRIWNFGSLDAEFALNVKPRRLKVGNYILVAYHPIPGEDPEELEKAIRHFALGRYEYPKYDVIRVASNSDYGKKYGSEGYSPEDYVNILRFASCAVGNSSSLFKEASIFGTSVVNVGSRQEGRLRTENIVDVIYETERIQRAIDFQLKNTYRPDERYSKPDTSKKIAEKIQQILI